MIFKLSLVFLLCLCCLDRKHQGLAQQSSSTVPLSGNGETCNVVNLHCGVTGTDHGDQKPPQERYPWPPGKIGPRGPKGPEGVKGETGSKGSKGEEAIVNVTDIINQVAGIFGAANCSDLRDLGIRRSGYYHLRSSLHLHVVYRYCDFQVHEGVSDCAGLRRIMSIKSGYYFMRSKRSSAVKEVFCSFGRSTCDELFQQGITESGSYTLEDDGGIFQVTCRFNNGRDITGSGSGDSECLDDDDEDCLTRQDPARAITEIHHSQMEEIQNPTNRRCSGRGCYSWTPSYLINRNHILSVITKSSKCRQFIRAKCVQTVLLGGHAWWVSRDGEKMTYWGGATSKRNGYCACGETGSCLTSSLKCNCDSNNANTGIDEGYLTDKTKLPVRELRFGDVDQDNEFVWHTLGKLECWGEA